MNWKNLFFISTVFWVAVFFVSNCTQQGGDEMADKGEEDRVAICPPGPDATPEERKRCEDIRGHIEGYQKFMAQTTVKVEHDMSYDPPEPHTIKPILDATTVNDTVVPWAALEDEVGLLRGFQFSIDDFKEIVKYANRVKKKEGKKYVVDSVYVMLAINPAKKNRSGYRIKYLDMYLQANKKEKATGRNEAFTLPHSPIILDEFDDFPLPCPYSCPPGE
ncbi:MAG: hypothetical protein AAF634_18015 [Bacteroidota bacterium]